MEPDEGLHKEGVTSATLHFIFFFPTLEKPELPPDHAHCWRNIATSGMPSSAGGKGGRWRWCSTDRAAPPSGATPSQSTGNLLASLPPCTVPQHSTPSSCSVLCLRQILTGHDELVAASLYLHVDRLMRLRVAPPGSGVAAFSWKKTCAASFAFPGNRVGGSMKLCHRVCYQGLSHPSLWSCVMPFPCFTRTFVPEVFPWSCLNREASCWLRHFSRAGGCLHNRFPHRTPPHPTTPHPDILAECH